MVLSVLRVSTTDAVTATLKERIASGGFRPGEKLPSERALQAELGVGRLALREGLARLAALGIIRVEHGRGAFVTDGASPRVLSDALLPFAVTTTPAGTAELLSARVIVESEAAALAAQNARPADVERLRAVLGRMAETLDDPQAYARLDLEFHRNTVEISGNRFLLLLFDALAPHVLRFLSAFVAVGGDRRAAVDRHWPLLQAIADRDAEAARALARTHSETARRDIEAAVRKPPRLRPGKRSRPTARRAR